MGRTSPKWPILWRCVLFFSRPRSEGWPHHGRTFSIFLCPLSLWLTLLQGVLSTSWCCPSRPCVVFLACAHLALFLSLSLSPGNSLVFSWCDHSMLASLLWRCLTVSSTPASLRRVKEPTHLFSLLSTKPTESIAVLSSQRRQDVFLYFNWVFSFHSSTLLQARLALSLVVSSWFFHIFCSDAPSWSHVAHRIRASCRFIIPPPRQGSMWSEYCDQSVARSVSVCFCISPEPHIQTASNFLCLLQSWQRYSTLCTSGIVDDVIFFHVGLCGTHDASRVWTQNDSPGAAQILYRSDSVYLSWLIGGQHRKELQNVFWENKLAAR